MQRSVFWRLFRAGVSGFAMILALPILTFCVALRGQDQPTSPPANQLKGPPSAAGPSASNLLPIPRPDLSASDPTVKQQIEEAQVEFQGVLGRKGAGWEEIGDAYGQMGMVYDLNGFSEAAIACFQNARGLAPQEFKWAYYLGRLYQDTGDNKNAITILKIAQEIRPNDVPVLVNLARVYRADGQRDAAKALYERVLTIDPTSAAADAGLGEIAMANRDYPATIRYLEAALKIQPEAKDLYYSLAMACRRSGDIPKAVAYLQKRGSGKPTVPDPLMDQLKEMQRGQKFLWEKGNKAMYEGRYADAVKIYEQMLAEAPAGDPLPRIYVGIALAYEGDLKGAIEQYQELLRLTPNSAIAHYNLGVLFFQLKSEDQALEHFNAAVDLDPGFRLAHFQLANLLMRNGHASEAIPHYAQAIQLGLDNAFLRLMKSLALVRSKRYPEAKAELEAGVAAFPESTDLKAALARLLAACPDKSVRDGQRSLTLTLKLLDDNPAPDFGLVETLGMALASVGRYTEAADLQKRMIADVEHAKRNDLAAELKGNLRLYEQNKANMLPWPDNDPIFVPQPGELALFAPKKGVPMTKDASSSQ
jgi:tetratricopeptide (TPR) repeat protein